MTSFVDVELINSNPQFKLEFDEFFPEQLPREGNKIQNTHNKNQNKKRASTSGGGNEEAWRRVWGKQMNGVDAIDCRRFGQLGKIESRALGTSARK